jgi:glycosyltransferase involved in cell wall biosynthesis
MVAPGTVSNENRPEEPVLNILIISPQFPYPTRSGFTTRVYQLVRQLLAHHSVTLLSYAWPHERDGVAALATQMSVRAVERKPLSLMGKRIAQAVTIASSRTYYCREVYSEAMQEAIDDLCSTENFDVIQLESCILCTFRFPRDTRLVIDEHNIEYELLQRMCEGERSLPRRIFNRVEHARFRRYEQACWERADACVVTSEREVVPVQTCAPDTPVAVVPNAVDLDYFALCDTPAEPHTVIFSGTLNYRPNLDAVHHLIDEIWPLVRHRYPDARLTLTGSNDGVDIRSLRKPGVRLLGEVPDVRPYVGRAEAVAVPIRIGGGTRLKVLEALAMGKPMVSTAAGCEGVAVRDGEHLLIADDAATFASRICEIFENPGVRDALGQAGRHLVETRYSWVLAGERLESLYRQISDTEPGRSMGPEVVVARA